MSVKNVKIKIRVKALEIPEYSFLILLSLKILGLIIKMRSNTQIDKVIKLIDRLSIVKQLSNSVKFILLFIINKRQIKVEINKKEHEKIIWGAAPLIARFKIIYNVNILGGLYF